MEEILASIRRIISDDKDAQPEAAGEPLELTQELQEDGSVVDVSQPEPEPEPEPEPVPAPEPEPWPEPMPSPKPEPVVAPVVEPVVDPSTLVSDQAAKVAATSLQALESTVEIEELASAPRGASYLGNGGRTLEDMVLELMRPMLKQWLDQNLPPIVDRLVQKEIERISRRGKN